MGDDLRCTWDIIRRGAEDLVRLNRPDHIEENYEDSDREKDFNEKTSLTREINTLN